MSIWGKLAGAAAELVRGGPTDNQLTFTVGVITLGAKIAKADGVLHPRKVKFCEKSPSVFASPRPNSATSRRAVSL